MDDELVNYALARIQTISGSANGPPASRQTPQTEGPDYEVWAMYTTVTNELLECGP